MNHIWSRAQHGYHHPGGIGRTSISNFVWSNSTQDIPCYQVFDTLYQRSSLNGSVLAAINHVNHNGVSMPVRVARLDYFRRKSFHLRGRNRNIKALPITRSALGVAAIESNNMAGRVGAPGLFVFFQRSLLDVYKCEGASIMAIHMYPKIWSPAPRRRT